MLNNYFLTDWTMNCIIKFLYCPWVSGNICAELLEISRFITIQTYVFLQCWLNNWGSGLPQWFKWHGLCLSVQKTQVQCLIQDDPTCPAATKATLCNCWACDLEPRATTTEHACCSHGSQHTESLCLQRERHRDEQPVPTVREASRWAACARS